MNRNLPLFSLLSLICVVLLTFCACSTSYVTDWQEQYNLGIRYLNEGNYKEAIVYFTYAIEIDSNNSSAYIGRAQAAIFSGETPENFSNAQADYEQARALGDTSAEIWLGLADIYVRQGDYEQAQAILKEGLDVTSNKAAIEDKITEFESGTFKDSSGHVRRNSYYDASGKLEYYFEFTYNTQGRRSNVTSYDANGTQVGSLELTYTPEGFPLKSWGSYGAELRAIVHEYNAEGCESRCLRYTPEGNLNDYSTYEYDDQGRVTRENIFDANDSLISYKIEEYDSRGDNTKESHYNAEGNLMSYTATEFNEQHLWIKSSTYSEDGAIMWYSTAEYDESGKMVRFTNYNADGTISNSVLYE